ncbi:cyclic nucleotide-binding protein [Burkholderiales bacterium JOSHI_001]|nr:cyclic nucleotide-binding protein [Burkholderiales bacterium JOSHI_001]
MHAASIARARPRPQRAARPANAAPTASALQFAERGHFSQVRAFAGEVLYTQDMPAGHMYVIKDGEVDLYLVRDEKRTVVETLKKGQCFGLEPHLHQQVRLHNAAARTYCELFLVDNETVTDAMAASPDLVQSLLDTLSQRLSVAHQLIATRVNYQSDLLIYAQLLQLLGLADIGKPAPSLRGGPAAQSAPLARPLLQDVYTNARLMFGHSDTHIRGCLGKLLALHLIRIEDERGAGKQVLFAPKDIVAQVRKAVSPDPDADKLSYEYVSVDEFAGLVEVDRAVLLRKLAAGEFADDVFTFRRAEILRLLNAKGKRFFADRKIKPPAEFSEVADLEFADAKTLFAVVSRVDTYDLAKVLAGLDDEAVRAKVLGALSRRRRDEVESDLKDMGPVDPLEAQQIGNALVAEVKALMLQQAR